MAELKTKNRKGFTLTEVMIGMGILAIAIVSATSLLTSLIGANRNNVATLQAYYLAQEGIEATRNIRDTNWLHNVDFKEGNGKIFPAFKEGFSYFLELDERGWQTWGGSGGDIAAFLPWWVEEKGPVTAAESDPYSGFALRLDEFIGPTNFYRHINILPYEENEDFFLVQSVVNWKDGVKDKNVTLETVLSDWKGGAL